MKRLSQDKEIEISYLSSGKWDRLNKSGMVFPQPCTHVWANSVDTDQMAKRAVVCKFSVSTVIDTLWDRQMDLFKF